jgi:hypothetical protein
VSASDNEDGVRLADDERLDWLRLIRSENVGPRGIMAQTPQGGVSHDPDGGDCISRDSPG